MYFCRVCGNMKTFIEHNLIKTELHIDEKSGNVISSHDSFLECADIECCICKATSNNRNIMNRKTGEIL